MDSGYFGRIYGRLLRVRVKREVSVPARCKKKSDNAPRVAIWMHSVVIGGELGSEGVVLSFMILYVASRGALSPTSPIRMHKIYTWVRGMVLFISTFIWNSNSYLYLHIRDSSLFPSYAKIKNTITHAKVLVYEWIWRENKIENIVTVFGIIIILFYLSWTRYTLRISFCAENITNNEVLCTHYWTYILLFMLLSDTTSIYIRTFCRTP